MNTFHHFEAEEHFDIEMRTVDGVTSYLVNGRKYGNLEEVPPAARAIIEKIKNAPPPGEGHAFSTRNNYEINGVRYDRLEDVPREYRSIITGMEARARQAPGHIRQKPERRAGRYCFDGREYDSFEDMPLDLRKKIQSMIEGPNTTIEYVTKEGVTRKYVDGEETPVLPGELSSVPGLDKPLSAWKDERYGPVRRSLPQAELYRKIVVNRMQPSDEIKQLHSLCSPFRDAEDSRRASMKVFGKVLTSCAYAALILWSQFQPAGFSSYIYLGFLIGDIVSWLIFTVWGWQKNFIEFDWKDIGIRVAGLLFFVLLTTRQGAFEVASGLRQEAMAALVMMAVVAAFTKWISRMFALIRRIMEGY
jgi:hypothetical protein